MGFAPTNEGFAKLPPATLAHLLKPANVKELDAILTYHVVSGVAAFSKDLTDGEKIKTVNGQSVVAHVSAAGVMINDATVKTADIAASNGVVHIIDAVLIPKAPAGKTIVDLAVATADLSTLVAALKAGGLVETLSGKGPFTVFAPTNEAFAKLPPATLAHLLKPANVKELDAILTYHVVSGVAAFSKDLTDGEVIKTVEGQSVVAHVSAAGVMINDATVKTADIAASNGVVHIIDTVLSIPEYKLHHVDAEDHKCFEATSASLFASKGITDSGACPASYNTIDKSVVVEQCPDGVTSIRYCSPIKVTIDSKGQAMMNSWTILTVAKNIFGLFRSFVHMY